MTQNATFKVFTVSELLRKNHQGRAGGQNTPPPREGREVKILPHPD